MLAPNNKKVRHIHKFKRSEWKMVNKLKQCKRVGRRSLQENNKRKGWLLQSRTQRGGPWPLDRMRSTDNMEKNTLYFASISNTQHSVSQAGDLRWGLS